MDRLVVMCICALGLLVGGAALAAEGEGPVVIDKPADIGRVLQLAGAGPALDGEAPELGPMVPVMTNPGELPRLRIAHDGAMYDLPLRHTDVQAELVGFAAGVTVTQRYANPFAFPIEAVYVFPLPESSAVDDMRIVIGERVIRGEVRKRKDARRIYEKAKAAGHTAALLEEERPNIFTQSIANIAPGTDIEVVIHYVQTLSYDAGVTEFVFPMVVGPRFVPGGALGTNTGTGRTDDTDEVPDASRISPPIAGPGVRTGHDISLRLTLDAAFDVTDFEAPTHRVDTVQRDDRLEVTLAEADAIPNRDFVFRFETDAPTPQAAVMAHKGARGGGTFALMLQPPALDVEALVGRRELVFVVDSSGSMSGVPLALAKEAVRAALSRLRPVDTFNVITFAGTTARAFSSSRPADEGSIRQALRFIDAAQAGGGTHLAGALDVALAPTTEAGRSRIVLFLTDGYVGNEDALFGQAEAMVGAMRGRGQKARVMALGTGSSVNRHLLDGLARAGDGTTVYVTAREQPTAAVDTFFRLVDHPVMTDITVDWGGLAVRDVEPGRVPDLFASRPVIVHGRYKRGGSGTVVLRGTADGRPVEVRAQVTLPTRDDDHAMLEPLWARARIRSLERDLWHGYDKAAVKDITELGLDFHIVTPWTSFVAVDRSTTVRGRSRTIVQPVDGPEAVDVVMAGPQQVVRGGSGGGGGSYGYGMGGVGSGRISVSGRGAVGSASGGGVAIRVPVVLSGKAEVRSAAKDVEGFTPTGAVRSIFHARAPAFHKAYEERLAEVAGLAGRLLLEWVIAADGSVSSARVVEDGVGDAALAEAVLAIVKKMRFPPPAGGGTTRVRMPLIFAPDPKP
ncbi:MAG: TonB family protein [Deltaproteobacteria bacterium]|nr:TonB family protein [Deltaproteobacteria bacterium]